MTWEHVKTSKFLSYILRHNPGAVGLSVDEEGWASVDELIACAARNGRNLTRTLLKDVIAANNKDRFSLSPDGQRIRANYGHSINVELNIPPVKPPAVLYHGTAKEAAPSILADGLKPLGRRLVHLSGDVETAVNVGKRHGDELVMQVDARKMDEEGFTFFSPTEGVWLVDCVPSKYLARRKPAGVAHEIDSEERMFRVITEMMNSNGFESYYPGWDNSNPKVLGSPRKWLQYETQRLYAKNDHKRLLGINLSWKKEIGKDPTIFLTCGLLQVEKEMTGSSNELSRAGWDDGQGVHIKEPYSPLILSIYEESKTAIICYFVKYVEAMDERDIRRSIVAPLVKMYDLIPEILDLASIDNAVTDAICAIPDCMLTIEGLDDVGLRYI